MQRCTVIFKEIADNKDRRLQFQRHQTGVDNFVNRTDKWQVKLNVDKRKVIPFHHRRYLNTRALPTYVVNTVRAGRRI